MAVTKRISSLLILVAATVGVYWFTFKYGFFQDDFYSLTNSQIHGFSDLLRWFIPGDEIYYRPISMRLYFWLMNTIFGLQPIAYHSVALTLHLLNALLAGKITGKLSGNSQIGYLVSLLYATSSIHFISLMWIAEIGLTMGITLYLLAIWTHLKQSRDISILALFITGLLIHEYVITLPAILLLLSTYGYRITHTRFWSLVGIAGGYLLLRLVIFPITATGSYSLALGKPTLWAGFWYAIWSLNIPENIKDRLEPGIKLNQTFLYDFPTVSLASVITIMVVIIIFIAIPMVVYSQATPSKRRAILPHVLFGIGWITITLSIPAITPLHLYPMYASLALVGISYVMVQLIYTAYKRPPIVAAIVTLGWIATSWQSTRFMEKIHWTVQEANRVQHTHQKLITTFGKISPESTIVINHDYQIEQALYGNLGLQTLFKDSTIKTHFGSVEAILPSDCAIIRDRHKCLIAHHIYLLPEN